MTRMTKRLEDGQSAMDCIACAKQGVVCHLLSCRNRLKERVCDYEDVMQSNGLVEQKHGRWKYYHKQNIAVCTNCSFERDLDVNFGRAVSCPNCGAKMDGDGNA